jgi:hypothetical protein
MILTGTGKPKDEKPEAERDEFAEMLPPAEPTVVNAATDVPTFFSDTVIFSYSTGNTARLHFMETIVEPQGSPNAGFKARHVGNLVMPIDGFRNMLAYLNEASKTWPDVVDGE